jgi:hypothetical protein
MTDLRPADEMFGEVDGTFAEYACLPDTAGRYRKTCMDS